MNPYYRCFEASDGFLAVACLNVSQRRAFLALLGLEDATVEAPDLVPIDAEVLAAKEVLTSRIEREIADGRAVDWLDRLQAAGVPCGLVHARESVYADPQVVAAGLVGEVVQPELGPVQLLAPFVRVGGSAPVSLPAPVLGADTDSVLRELA
jgi:crotonobetainyl-CoA:carnitine CoA-transferase CaiB-like acyl-CoA transferase